MRQPIVDVFLFGVICGVLGTLAGQLIVRRRVASALDDLREIRGLTEEYRK